MKAVIMAGGSGTRLWPISRQHTPKQGQPFGDDETLLQKTYARVRRGWPDRDILVSTNLEQFPLLRKQLKKLRRANYILETARRDTAPAIGLVATYLHRRNPQEIMFTANSDTYVKEVDEYVRLLRTAERTVAKFPNQTILIGIKPKFPDTSLGYIKMQRQIEMMGKYEVFLVERFVEKPDLATAKRYIASWQYLCNPAMFVFRVDSMLEKFRRWMNPTYKLLMRFQATIGTRRELSTLKRLYPKMQKTSIDYGIMERDREMLVIPSDLTWSDIGSWGAVYDMLSERDQDNVVRGRHVHVDSRGNFIYSTTDKVVTTAGLRDMIVVDTDDALLICPRDRSQDVKKLVAELQQRKLHRYL